MAASAFVKLVFEWQRRHMLIFNHVEEQEGLLSVAMRFKEHGSHSKS